MSTIKVYKPNDTARIEAMLFTEESAEIAFKWAGNNIKQKDLQSWGCWWVKTLEGWINLPYGYYLAKGTNGEFYPIDSEIFKNRWMEE